MKKYNYKNFFGLTLLEMLIAITISLLILTGVMSLYLNLQKLFSYESALSEIQEKMLMASEIFHQDILWAGFIGCAKLEKDFPIVNHTSIELMPTIEINNNEITVKHATAIAAELAKNMRSYSVLYIASKITVSPGDNLLISNCQRAELFTVKNADITDEGVLRITSEQPLQFLYPENTEIRQFEMNHYYVALTGRSVYALYVKKWNQAKMELIENVNDMEVRVDENNGVEIKMQFVLRQLRQWAFCYISLRE